VNRKICVITGSRADYGLLRRVIKGIQCDLDLTLQLIVTGTHLSKDYGLTYEEIKQDGFKINAEIHTIGDSDSPAAIAESMGRGLTGFGSIFEKLKPDLLVVLGDRFEILAATAAALVARIPVAHIHGGEVTEGAYDDAIRHSITKMSNLHFVATEKCRKRVIQLGEDPNSVFLVGGLGVDAINNVKLFTREELQVELGIKFLEKSLLITFHPETLSSKNPAVQFNELLHALQLLEDTTLVFTMPNADTGGREIAKMVEQFANTNINAHYFKSLGQRKYLSTVAQVDGVIGNSSSGILEVPSFKKGTINIGGRQKGREQALSVINCEPDRESLRIAIAKLFSQEFRTSLRTIANPYGAGGASGKIVGVLRSVFIEECAKKAFYDL
jgi:GDP/UDP-N,N'-diacetylbacillosamine 2-epimerase (hydrolysing)